MTEAYTQLNPTTFDWYESALKGVRLDCNANEPMQGYYRYQAKDKTGAIKILPVAFWYRDGHLFCKVGAEFISKDRAISIWPFASKRPIPFDLYQSVMAGTPWPDEVSSEAKAIAARVGEPKADIPAGDGAVARDHNQPPEVLPEVAAAEAIDNAIKVAQGFATITSNEQAELALGSKNRLANLRLAANKAGKAVYGPPFAEYKRLFNLWNPMVSRADVAEKAINRAVLVFREKERQRVAAEAKAAEEAAKAEQEANERAADRAIAAGEPEPAPVVAAAPVAAAPAPIKPTYGRRGVKEEVKKFAVIEDPSKVFEFFKDDPEMVALLQLLANIAVRAGRPVPGASVREGLI